MADTERAIVDVQVALVRIRRVRQLLLGLHPASYEDLAHAEMLLAGALGAIGGSLPDCYDTPPRRMTP